MSRARRLGIAAAIGLPLVLLVYILTETELETRLPARANGTLSAELALGSGLSFHRGSLEIRSHDAGDVRVATSMWGWGKYAVDVQARERGGDVQVVGRVEGLLHWIFAGPTVDVRIFVPEGYGVEAHVDGGPLVLEDLSGPIEARVAEGGRNTITLRRTQGIARLAARGGRVRVDHLEGSLKVEAVDGGVVVSDVAGTVVVAAQRGAEVEIRGVRGDVHAASEYGSVLVRDAVGNVDLETEDGNLRVAGLDGRLRARSRHGDVAVEFRGSPSGIVETEAGAIDVEVPASSGFDLDVRAREGDLDLDDSLAFVRDERPESELGPLLEQDVEDAARLGGEIAAEVHQKLSDRLRRYLERRRRGEDGGETWNEDWSWSWDDPDWRWYDHEWALEKHGGPWRWGDWGDGGGDPETRRVTGTVHGGGADLVLRTQAGRVRVRD